MKLAPIQDFYPPEIAICYGCGPYNNQGLHIQTYWDGKEGRCHFRPQPQHTAFPGTVYGGLIASVIDCHSIGTAVASAYEAEGREPGTSPQITFVTGTLKVTYLKPTPMDQELLLRSRVESMEPRKTLVATSLYAGDQECALGEVVAVRAPWVGE
ncbi:MAG: PaaI family thioesterase [Desulfarculaceae bacterium]|jgi:acyl-coenzyme A thioesterase PaaI-like protein